LVCLLSLCAYSQILLEDDFSSNTSDSWTTSGTLGTIFNVSRSGNDWGARRALIGRLELTNDTSASVANVTGWVFVNAPVSALGSNFNPILNQNAKKIEWVLNLRQIRTDPAGVGSTSSYGVAFVLCSTTNTILDNASAKGYAIVLGETGSLDPIRLVTFSGGLNGMLSPIIISHTDGLSDFGNEYLSLKVVYDPVNSNWTLFLRNDGPSNFQDARTGTFVSQGSFVDPTYTATTMNYFGFYWQGSTASMQTAYFDNLRISLVDAVTPSASAGEVYGRVTLNGKRGIPNAKVTATDETGKAFTAFTNAQGYYRITGLDSGKSYVVSVMANGYNFQNGTLFISLSEGLYQADFTANR
jgi:hypothetical protein